MPDQLPRIVVSRLRWLSAAVLCTLFGLLGLASPQTRASLGLTLATDGTVTQVEPEGPADTAGVQVDDRVIAIDGVD